MPVNRQGTGNDVFRVVVNDEEQYSIWPARKELPAGWRAVGFEGTRAMALAYIADAWTDMRPLSVRGRLSGNAPA
jgi:MbtH protein